MKPHILSRLIYKICLRRKTQNKTNNKILLSNSCHKVKVFNTHKLDLNKTPAIHNQIEHTVFKKFPRILKCSKYIHIYNLSAHQLQPFIHARVVRGKGVSQSGFSENAVKLFTRAKNKGVYTLSMSKVVTAVSPVDLQRVLQKLNQTQIAF